jgi:hypothetical protein
MNAFPYGAWKRGNLMIAFQWSMGTRKTRKTNYVSVAVDVGGQYEMI